MRDKSKLDRIKLLVKCYSLALPVGDVFSGSNPSLGLFVNLTEFIFCLKRLTKLLYALVF